MIPTITIDSAVLCHILVPLCSLQVRAEKNDFEAFPSVSLYLWKQQVCQMAAGSWQRVRIAFPLLLVIYRSWFLTYGLSIAGVWIFMAVVPITFHT